MNVGPFCESAHKFCPVEVLSIRSAKTILLNPLIELKYKVNDSVQGASPKRNNSHDVFI